jgi:hypothetical protein
VRERSAISPRCDIVFVMVSTWDDVHEVVAAARRPAVGATAPEARRRMLVDLARRLGGTARAAAKRGIALLAAPVSGNAKVIKAGRLSFVCSGPKSAFDAALPYLKMIAPAASYVGEGELARIVKICHNVILRRGHAIAGRDHGARAEGRRAAPRLSRFHEPERDGLDVLALQDAGVREPRLQGDVHAALLRKDSTSGSTRRRFDVPMPLARSRATSCRR